MSGREKDKKNRKKDCREEVQRVVRGEFYLDFEFLKNWNEELKEMKEKEEGSTASHFMKWLAVWKQWIDYRGLEGIASLYLWGSYPSDFSSIWYRIHSMIPEPFPQMKNWKQRQMAQDYS